MLEVRKETLRADYPSFSVYPGSAPSYMAVENSTAADLYVLFGQATSRGSDEIHIPPKSFFSLAIPSPEYLTVFWEISTYITNNGTVYNSPLNSREKEIIFYFSDYPISAGGFAANPGGLDYQIVFDKTGIIMPSASVAILSSFGDHARRLVGIIRADQSFTVDVQWSLTGSDGNILITTTQRLTAAADTYTGGYNLTLDIPYSHNVLTLKLTNGAASIMNYIAYLRNCPI